METTTADNFQIRAATLADAEPISTLVTALSREFIVPDLSDEGAQNLLRHMTPEATRGFMQDDFRYHVAEDGAELVGFVATRNNTHLYHLFVAKTHQRRGLSRRLWDTARAACLKASNTTRFTVNSSRFALPVYQRFGFVAVSEEIEKYGVLYTPMELHL